MPEAKVHVPGRKDVEIDLWAIVDGRIVIGKAKPQGKLQKTAGEEADPTRRRVRGIAPQWLFAGVLVAAANIRKITNWLAQAETDESGTVLEGPVRKRRARQNWRSLDEFDPRRTMSRSDE